MVCLAEEELIDSAVLVCRICLYWSFGNFPLNFYVIHYLSFKNFHFYFPL